MALKKYIVDEVRRLSAMEYEPGKVFWFDIDLVELGLFNRCYGIKKGDEFIESLETFLNNVPEIKNCLRMESGRFVFKVITDKPYSDREIVTYWKETIEKFVLAKQDEYPDFCIRISCGISTVCPPPYTLSNVTEVIDNATFARKESRKNKAYKAVVFTDDLLNELNARQKKEISIIRALIEDRFIYYLQPIVDLKTGRIIGAEALSRGVSDSGEIISPGEFLPLMEENGSVIDLDYLILRKVCARLKERIEKGLPVICTSINLSRMHLEEDDTVENLSKIASEYGIKPELLNFELTETVPLDEFSKAKEFIDELRAHGFKVSIDDYGSGYTGITVWTDLDFDILKMDKKFLSDEDETIKTRNNVLIPNTIELAKKMSINVVCEGVERSEQCESLLKWSCNIVQGFYFSKPIPVDEFYKYYEENNGMYPIKFSVKDNLKWTAN